MASVWATNDDAKEPRATPVDGACENGAESSNRPEDHNGDSRADAIRQKNRAYVAVSHTEDQHVGESKGDREAAIHRKHDPLTLSAKYGLADEMEDGSLRRKAQNSGLEDALERRGSTARRGDGSPTLDELTHS